MKDEALLVLLLMVIVVSPKALKVLEARVLIESTVYSKTLKLSVLTETILFSLVIPFVYIFRMKIRLIGIHLLLLNE